MKKNVLLLMTAAATLAGCSNDETVDVLQQQQQSIGFKTFVDKATRADVTSSSLQNTGFWVWADANSNSSSSSSLILAQDKVSYSTSSWTSATTRFWQADTKYAFTAIGPANDLDPEDNPLSYTHTVPTNAADFLNKLHGSLTYDISKSKAKVDLVHAFSSRELPTTPQSGDYAAVDLTFNHLLSKVIVEFVNNVGEANLRITNLKVKSAKTGSLTLQDLPKAACGDQFVWNGLADTYTTDALSLTQGDLTNVSPTTSSTVKVISANGKANNDAIYLLPKQETISISFDVQVYSGSQPGETCAHTGTATITGGLVAGHSYKLTTTLTTENVLDNTLQPIEFNVYSVASWIPDTDVPVVM